MRKFNEGNILKTISKGLFKASNGEIPNVELLQGVNEIAAYSFFEYNLSNYPGSYYDLISLCYKPLSEWEMIRNENYQDKTLLLPDGNLSDFALEITQSKDNDLIVELMKKFRRDKDGQKKYTYARRFLIENPVIKMLEFRKKRLNHKFSEVFEEISGLYEKPPLSSEKNNKYHICESCSWIANFNKYNQKSCSSSSCSNDSIEVAAAESYLRVKKDVMTFVVNPGKAELEILDKINQFTNIETELWPYFDAFDIELNSNNEKWALDVKDYIDPKNLAASLEIIPDYGWDKGFYVIPTHRANKSYMRAVKNNWEKAQNNVEIISEKDLLKRLEVKFK
jgi:hypothetical protein